MFQHCIFCHSDLGRNESIEHFQTGRRLAYDQWKGRLWVVCPRCNRWNLSPLEERWEAIEEAERAYSTGRLRASTENIALAKLSEGLELVRVGTPPPLELASWRYGDQFRRRRWRGLVIGGVGATVPFLTLLGPFGWAAALGGGAVVLTHGAISVRATKRDQHVPTVFLRGDDGLVLPLTKHDTWSAMLVPADASDWHLTVNHRQGLPVNRRWYGAAAPPGAEPTVITGVAARHALSALLPYANAYGASERRIREGLAFIGSAPSLNELVHRAATAKAPLRGPRAATALTRLPVPMRVGLEIALHEEDERVALEGDMRALEQRWRDAEEIAGIADSLLTSPTVEAELERLRRQLAAVAARDDI